MSELEGEGGEENGFPAYKKPCFINALLDQFYTSLNTFSD